MFERRRLRVYVAGPISGGDVFENIMSGLRWGRQMLRDGLAPYVPHMDAYMTLTPGATALPTVDAFPWNALLEWDIEWVAGSEAVFRIAGASKGADLECKIARELGIPVFYEDEYAQLLEMAAEQGLNGVRVGGAQA